MEPLRIEATRPRVSIMEYRVSYRETDQMAAVYYSNYLEWAERARTEWLRGHGLCYREWEDIHRLRLPIRQCALRYYAPARYDELVQFATALTALGRASLRFDMTVWSPAGRALCDSAVELACVDEGGKPTPIPETYRSILGQLLHATAGA